MSSPKLTRATSVAVAVLSLLVLGGCAATLVPGPGAQVVPGPGHGAVARDDGVQISASTEAWTGRPSSLPSFVTPILVTVENNTSVPLRVTRNDFALVADDGARLVPRDPHTIQGFATEPAPPGLVYPRFSLGLGRGTYRGWGRYGGPFGHGDPFLYDDPYFPMSVRVPLPTPDMLSLALPEQVLQPGERAAGFLYLDRVKRGAKRLDFKAGLVNATTGQQVATITIPFVVD